MDDWQKTVGTREELLEALHRERERREAAERQRDAMRQAAEEAAEQAVAIEEELSGANATLAAVREALLPFAKQADRYDEPLPNAEPWEDDHYPTDQDFTVGDFRRARAAILDEEGDAWADDMARMHGKLTRVREEANWHREEAAKARVYAATEPPEPYLSKAKVTAARHEMTADRLDAILDGEGEK